eukprot:2493121-Amphidinium_carterae.1
MQYLLLLLSRRSQKSPTASQWWLAAHNLRFDYLTTWPSAWSCAHAAIPWCSMSACTQQSKKNALMSRTLGKAHYSPTSHFDVQHKGGKATRLCCMSCMIRVLCAASCLCLTGMVTAELSPKLVALPWKRALASIVQKDGSDQYVDPSQVTPSTKWSRGRKHKGLPPSIALGFELV